MKYKAKIANYRIIRKEDIILIRSINNTYWLLESFFLFLIASSIIAAAILITLFTNLQYWLILIWIVVVVTSLFIFWLGFQFLNLRQYRHTHIKINLSEQSLKFRKDIFHFDEIVKVGVYEVFNDGIIARLRKHDFVKIIQLELKNYREVPLIFVRGKIHQATDTYYRDIFQKTEAAQDLKTYLKIILDAKEKSVLEIQEEEKSLINQSNV